MLQSIRDNSQGVIAKIIIGLIVAVFALFGVESIIGGFITTPPVAEVNGVEITEAQLQSRTQNLIASSGANVDLSDQDFWEQIALNRLVEETLLRQTAENAAMSVSSDRIDRAIIETQSFQLNGTFDQELAVRTMVSQGFSVPLYRQSLGEQMLLAQLANAYASSNFVTGAELDKIANLTAQTRNFRYLSVTMGNRTADVPVTDEQIAAYYEENQQEFEEEETVVLSYVLLDKDLIAEELQLDEAEVLARYQSEREEFEGALEKRASHILFEVNDALSEDAARELAVATAQRLVDGEDFGALALELSDDTVSAEAGGDIGYTDGSVFPPEVESALNELALDEVSAPVVSEFGVHLVKLTEAADNDFQPFEEVRERIERDLKSAEVELIYGERLENLSNLAFESGDLQSIGEQLGLEIQQSEPLSRAGGGGIFSDPDIVAAAFSDEVLLDGNNSDAIELDDSRSAVVRVQDFNPAFVRPLEEASPEISVLLRTQMEREAVQALGAELFAAAESGAELDQLILDNELEWVEEQDVERDSVAASREIVEQVFRMPKPEDGSELAELTLSNDAWVLIDLTEVNPGTPDALPEEELNGISESMQTTLGSNDFQALLNNLRDNSEVEGRALEQAF